MKLRWGPLRVGPKSLDSLEEGVRVDDIQPEDLRIEAVKFFRTNTLVDVIRFSNKELGVENLSVVVPIGIIKKEEKE
ncbi:MAG: hypothetical protein LC687_01625 [Actinobacteria bacterium]|nr:hypothetical protein [Actinomycetota bacterium]